MAMTSSIHLSTSQALSKTWRIVRLMRRITSLLPRIGSHHAAMNDLADGYQSIAERESDPELARLYRDAASQIRPR